MCMIIILFALFIAGAKFIVRLLQLIETLPGPSTSNNERHALYAIACVGLFLASRVSRFGLRRLKQMHCVSQVPSVPHHDRPLPALRTTNGPGEVLPPRPAAENARSPGLPHSPGSSHASPALPGGTAEAEPLSEQAQREAGLSLEVFGEGLVGFDYDRRVTWQKVTWMWPGLTSE